MRRFQIGLFCLGTAAFLASAAFIERSMGDTLWKVGVAAMIGDIVCIQLWPTRRRRG